MVVAAAPQNLRYRVSGMDCSSCAAKIETAIRRVPGTSDIAVNTASETLRVKALDAGEVERVVRELGYSIAPADLGGREHRHADENGPWWRTEKARLTLFSGLALVFAWGLAALLPGYEAWLYTTAMLVGLVPIARRAVMAARAGAPFTIETLMSVAAIGAVLIGETEEAAIVVLLFLVGELLEGVAAGRARVSIRSLTALVPKTALLEKDGALNEVEAASLSVGDVIQIRPGDRIPADGTILSGESAIDEAPVTGESTPKRKGDGETVFAGTINTDATLRVRVSAAAEDNTIARVVRRVEEAQEAKAPSERFIDRFSRYYTPVVLIVGALVAVLPPLLAGEPWGEWVYKRALWTVVVLNVGMGLAEIVAGFVSGSQALKADALDFLGDGTITFLGLIAIGWSLVWRARAALFQGAFLGVLGVGVLATSAYRVLVLHQPEADIMGLFGVFALVVNVASAWVLLPHRTGDANVRAVWLFSRNDAIGNVAVIVAAGLVAWTRTAWPDLVVAVVIASLFLQSSWSIMQDARRELNGGLKSQQRE